MEQIEDDDIIEDSFEDDGVVGMMTVIVDETKNKKSPPARTSLSLEAIKESRRVDRLCEFAECLMHCLLFKINYYDKKAHFDKCIKYDVVVYRCKSEIVCEYISNCIECLRLVLYEKCNIDSVSSDLTSITSLAIGLAVLRDPNTSSSGSNLLIKRYTLEIDLADKTKRDVEDEEEWNYRDAILKCLYAKETQYPSNFRWQIQLRTSVASMKELNKREDLFKLFAWRECNQEETQSQETQLDSKKTRTDNSYNQISISPIKTLDLGFSKCQLFLEQPVSTSTSITSTNQLSQRLKKRARSSRQVADNNSDSNE